MNGCSKQVRTTCSRVLWTSEDKSAQFQARVSVFGENLVRVGISRHWYNVEEDRFVPSAKGHCYFPVEVLAALKHVLPDLQAEAELELRAAKAKHGTFTQTSPACRLVVP